VTASHTAESSAVRTVADARWSPPAARVPVAVSAGPIEAAIEYYSRLALSQPPRPREPVVVDYPYFDGADDHYVGEFDVFVDDTGGVVRVTPATPNLPGILVNAVREAFLAARFAPGELQGRPGALAHSHRSHV
jgi:hypothetical protein